MTISEKSAFSHSLTDSMCLTREESRFVTAVKVPHFCHPETNSMCSTREGSRFVIALSPFYTIWFNLSMGDIIV